MTTCTRCGHRIDVGRFCTNCGAAVGAGPSDTAERPAVPAAPAPPPPLPPAPSAARYPLYADEVVDDRTGPVPLRAPEPAPAYAQPAHAGSHRGGGGWLVWGVIAAVLVVVALVGATLLLATNGDDDQQAADPAGSTDAATTEPSEPEASGPESQPAESEPAEEPPSGEPAEVAAAASAAVPSTAPPGTAVGGGQTRYDAELMLDGDPGTCWRMVGDGTGDEIVLTLAEPTLVSELGLVNGYAKTAQDAQGRKLDWYAGNRRVLAVEWVLDDGTTIPQDLDETRDLQTVEVDGVVTRTVVLRLVEVSAPGNGRAARDNTAISELSVVGMPS